jgi:hypothetical protein
MSYSAAGVWADGYGPGGDVSIYRPSGDLLATGWVSTAATLAGAINEATPDDASYITSPDLSTAGPARMSLPSMAAGAYTLRTRARRTADAGELRVVCLDGADAPVGATEWQALTGTYEQYTLPVTISATATRFQIEVRGDVWSPVELFASGEQGAWYDPSDFSTMFQDTAGTVPVTAVGQSVARINDKSGRGNNATQATTAARPLLEQDAGGLYYLRFDGVDDGMLTANIDFTATDKMTVLAGVRKLSDSLRGSIVEAGSSYGVAGSFGVMAPHGNGATTMGFYLTGTTTTGLLATGIVAPLTSVASCLFDISGSDRASEVFPRVNGSIPSLTVTDAASAGTGNYGNRPIFIGRRGGTTLPFNGRIYSLIVRGAASTTDQITAAETWVNGKTGAY